MPPARLALVAREPRVPMPAPAVKSGEGGWSGASPGAAMLSAFGYGINSAGVPVTPYTALTSSAVYACVRCLSDDIAKLPLQMHRRLASGGFAVDLDHPLNRLLRRPNRWQTRFQFMSYWVASLALRGNGCTAILRGPDGAPRALVPLNPDRTTILRSPQGWLYYAFSHALMGDAGYWTLHQDDVMHIKNYSLDGYTGVSPIYAMGEAIGLSLATQTHGGTLFSQGAQIAGVLKAPKALSPEAAKRMAASWRDVHSGVRNASKTAVLEEGVEFEKIGMTSDEAQFLATRGFQVIDICRGFRVPPHKIQSLDRATFTNIENQNQQYIDDALIPIARQVEETAEEALLFDDERGTYQLRFDFDSLLRGDQKSRFDSYHVALGDGWMTQNQVRIRENLAPFPGGDVYRVALNTAPVKPTETPGPAAIAAADPQE